MRHDHDCLSFIFLGIFGILNQKFEGKIPVFELIEARKIVAKFIGLTFFKLGRECLMKFGPNCAINGPCCALHRLEGLKEAHELFPKLFEPFGINLNKIDATSDTFFTSLLAVLIDFKTQIVVSDLALKAAKKSSDSSKLNGLSIHLENLFGDYYGNSMEIPYLKGKLQQRAVQLRGLLEQQQHQQEGNLSEILREKYPIDLFESNLKNVLRNVYSAFPETFINELVSKSLEEQEPKKINLVKPIDTKSPAVTATTTNIGTTTITTTATVNNNSNNNILAKPSASVNVVENPFKNVIISGKFFRGILEPVDERFAAIIEGRDVHVKQYLNQRKKKNSEKINIEQAKKENMRMNTSIINTNTNAKYSLMERHNSAERISWETQQTADSNAEFERETKEEKRPVYRPVSSSTSNSKNKRPPGQRGRRMFSEQEVLNLIEGIRRFGRDWRRILDTYEFNDRTNVDLKDKARNLEKLGLL